MPVRKIISGGQTGADRAGLDAAVKLGIKTGGYCPKDFLTEKGKDFSLKKFKLTEIEDYNFDKRTKMNILESDGTVIFCKYDNDGKIFGDGTILTYNYAVKIRKPVIVNPTEREFIKWIKDENIEILNVAGNRESVYPGVYKKTKDFLIRALAGYSNLIRKKNDNKSLFSDMINDIVSDRISGSSAILINLLDALYFRASESGELKKIYREVKESVKIVIDSFPDMTILKSFYEEFISNSFSDLNNLRYFLSAYKKNVTTASRRIAQKAYKEIEFNNKIVLLHSNSSSVFSLFSYLQKKNINVKILQTESIPGSEGIYQADKLSELGFDVEIVSDSSTALAVNKCDMIITGADAVYEDCFVNKTGTLALAISAGILNKPFYVLAERSKFIQERKNNFNPDTGTKNNYFEEIPSRLITKFITDKK